MKSGDARVVLIGFPSVGKVRENYLLLSLLFLIVDVIKPTHLHTQRECII